jgi:predicted MFS family arabinose efflux permease
MVIPFLSLYLTEDLSFSKNEVGWIMFAFGLGSVAGTWIGGKVTDSIGYYKVLVRSLLGTGVLFILLQLAQSFFEVCAGIFLVMVVADTFRPAMFVAINAYSKPENKTRSVTLIRLAINLGFSAGPAIGGLIISTMDYGGLFWVDGITCSLAAILLIKVLNPKKVKPTDNDMQENPISAYRDAPYWVFFTAMFVFMLIFIQYFSTMPLYYREVFLMSEIQIGILLGLNGFLIFALEMPLIHWLEKTKISKVGLTLIGLALTVMSFAVLNLSGWIGILVIGMILATVGEMIGFPFSNAFAIERSKKGLKGQYLGMYAMSFAVAHVFGHTFGFKLIEEIGYTSTWYLMSLIGLVGVFLLWLLLRTLKNKNELY